MKPREDAYLDELGRFAVEARLSDLSDRAHKHIRWVLVDCLPVIAAGMRVDEMKALVAAQLDTAAPGNAWVIGTGRRASAMDAALLNGTAGTWLELDEGNLFAKGHPVFRSCLPPLPSRRKVPCLELSCCLRYPWATRCALGSAGRPRFA